MFASSCELSIVFKLQHTSLSSWEQAKLVDSERKKIGRLVMVIGISGVQFGL